MNIEDYGKYVDGNPVERIRAGEACHNVWVDGEQILYCDSAGQHRVMAVGGHEISPPIPGFIRGVAYAGNKRYLAVSPKGRNKEDRQKSNSYIMCMNDKWEVEHICVNKERGEIYEIRAAAADPVTHNGLLCPSER